MPYIIDNQSYMEIAGRKFLPETSIDIALHEEPVIPHVKHSARNIYSKNFGIIQFKADFSEDVQIRDMKSLPHVSLHFQIKGNSNARFRDIKNEHPLRTAEYNIYYSEDFHSDISFNRQNDFEYLAVILDKSFLLNMLEQNQSPVKHIEHSLEQQNPFALFEKAMPVTPQMHSILKNLVHCPVADNLSQMYLNGKICELLALQLEQYQNSNAEFKPASSSRKELATLTAYIDENFLTVHHISQLASISTLSEHQIARLFKQQYDVSVYEFIQEKRMLYARQRLVESDVTVTEIAWETGYANSSNFIQAFKRKFLTTPKQLKINSQQ